MLHVGGAGPGLFGRGCGVTDVQSSALTFDEHDKVGTVDGDVVERAVTGRIANQTSFAWCCFVEAQIDVQGQTSGQAHVHASGCRDRQATVEVEAAFDFFVVTELAVSAPDNALWAHHVSGGVALSSSGTSKGNQRGRGKKDAFHG